MPYFNKIEWEFLKNSKEYDLSSNHYELNISIPNCNKLKIKRDEQYNIIGLFSGECFNVDEVEFVRELFRSNSPPKFQVSSNSNILTFSCSSMIKLTFDVKKNYEFTFYIKNLNNQSHNFNKEEISWTTEWYVNGSSEKAFKRATEYIKKDFYVKNRLDLNSENFNYQNSSNFTDKISSIVRDYLFIEPTNCSSFIIGKVPERFGPNWSNCIGIEYQKQFGFPSQNDMKKIHEILSFFFGRLLIKVGETSFDKNGWPLNEISIEPNISPITNLKIISGLNDLCPIKYDLPLFNNCIEQDLKLLLDNYICMDENFSNVFKLLFDSMLTSTDSAIVIIAGALDFLVDYWLSNKKTEFLSKEEYNNIVKAELKSINEKLDEYPQLLNKINNAYKKSGTSRYDDFFEDIGIEVGKVEKKAMDYRNIIAHGHKMKPETEIKLIFLTYVYMTLLNRCILKILGFTGNYNDLCFNENRNINLKIPEEKLKEIKNMANEYINEN